MLNAFSSLVNRLTRFEATSSPKATAVLASPTLAIVLVCLPLFVFTCVAHAEDLKGVGSATSLTRVTADIKYLSSDELKGRQPGTPEMKMAEDHIVAAYKAAGLEPINDTDEAGAGGGYFQSFDAGQQQNAVMVDPATAQMTLTGPDGASMELELGDQYSQLIYKGGIDLENLQLVFVGYGIDAAQEHNYDEYADVDVEGKIVVLIRREPQQDDPNSVFDGDDVSRYAYLQTKVRRALEANAAAVLMVNDSKTIENADGVDELPAAEQFGAATRAIPFVQIKREIFDSLLDATPVITFEGDSLTSANDIEKQIDATLSPLSQSLPGWKATIKASFKRKTILTNNIVGVIEGAGPLADETIVIGAHYDHLGMGAYGSRSPDAGKAIHNGADDNATGTAAVIELARRFAAADKKPKRRLVFICFSAEEMGLLGARYYVDNPVFPLEKTVAMINFDMIGYLRGDRLSVYGWNTSPDFAELLDESNKNAQFKLVKPPGGFAGSDHLPFDNKKIPNLFLHTGLNSVYHTPEDDFEAINCDGAVKVIDFSMDLIRGLANGQTPPTYKKTSSPGSSAKLGVGVQLNKETGRIELTQVFAGTAAEKAGLKKGDQIVSWDGNTSINSRRRIARQIKKDAGKSVKIKVRRGEREVLVTVDLNE